MTTEADTESGIDQETHYQGIEDTPDVDIEFGGLGAVVGKKYSGWFKFKRLFHAAAKGAASSGAVKDALNAYSPGLGDAAQKGMQLVEAGNAGDPQALAQIAAVTDKAKADPTYGGAYEMLKTISDARAEVAAAVEVGKKKVYVVTLHSGKKKKFKSKAAMQAWMKANPEQRPQQAGQQRRQQRPATQQDVRQAIQRTPPQGRPQLTQAIQQAQAQGRYPVRPVAPGQAYGMQPPYGYGSPYAQGAYGNVPMSQPYGPQWYSPPQYEQEYYYQGQDYGDGDADYELEQAFAGDEQFPDEAMQGEPSIAYQG